MDRIIKLNSRLIASAGVTGGKEHEGPIGDCFDFFDEKDKFGKKTWEQSESEMQRIALTLAKKKAGIREDDIGALFAGDLLNQCIGSAYGLLDFDIPYFGLYGACSTGAEGIMLASIMTSFGIYNHCAAVTSSHNCSAERQYRTPIEYGGLKPGSAQWTVTGSGAFIVGGGNCTGVHICSAMPGIVVEKGIKDANNMGAAMAPSAASTLMRFFGAGGKSPSDYDLILTGDLGYEGGSILRDLLRTEGIKLGDNYNDCGTIIYSRETQKTLSGGSGCGCSAVVLASYILPKIASGELKHVLFLGTGAMMSPDSIKQGEAIPAVAHLIEFDSE